MLGSYESRDVEHTEFYEDVVIGKIVEVVVNEDSVDGVAQTWTCAGHGQITDDARQSDHNHRVGHDQIPL